MMTEAELIEQALTLPSVQRADIARKLLESLDEGPADSDADQAWADEVEARAAAYDRGEVSAIDSEQVFDRARQSIRQGKPE
jgi:putative addiction module component (TIGR02574 family)